MGDTIEVDALRKMLDEAPETNGGWIRVEKVRTLLPEKNPLQLLAATMGWSTNQYGVWFRSADDHVVIRVTPNANRILCDVYNIDSPTKACDLARGILKCINEAMDAAGI